ncbi:metallopeptidase [Aureococcus anophagefferens]|nr:metallopeptidase [Aureococcus anophagefferens]
MASLERVVLTSESVFATVAHALSTERQEVMGLLFGRWDGAAVEVESVMPLPRLDKRSDRVEVTGPQLAEAAQVAESLGLRVVGWYHSHPHITVQASHVDVRTQAQYQALDGRFFGLICACFQGADGAGAAAAPRPRGAEPRLMAVPLRRAIIFRNGLGAFRNARARRADVESPFAAAGLRRRRRRRRRARRSPRAAAAGLRRRRGAGARRRRARRARRDIPIAVRRGAGPSLRRALETLAALQDALFREEAGAPSGARAARRRLTRSSTRPPRSSPRTRSTPSSTSPPRPRRTSPRASTPRRPSGQASAAGG